MITPGHDNTILSEDVERGSVFAFKTTYKNGDSHLCGYVHYPDGGPNLDMYDLSDGPHIKVHGGVTYEKRGDEGYTAGFDCAHAGDRNNPKTSDPQWVLSEAKRMHRQILPYKRMADGWRRAQQP
jgi:hypothetical protein